MDGARGVVAEVGIRAVMKGNCRSFVAALLWMTSIFVEVA